MSKSDPLQSLCITAFRGSSTTFTLQFEKNRKLTLVYGENGTGKTTICDAFELLAHQCVSSLEGCGLGRGLDKYWPTAGKNVNDLSVILKTSADTCTAKVAGKIVSVTPPASKPKIELLRRQQILNLIQAQPKERYDAIKRFIDIATFEVSEDELRQQLKNITNERNNSRQAENQSFQELQDFFEAAGSPEELDVVSWAKQKLAESTVSLDADIKAILTLRTAFDTIKKFPERVAMRQQVVKEATTGLVNADSSLAQAAADVVDGMADMLPVLEVGNTYMNDHPGVTECPLCLSKENIEGLAHEIGARLTRLGELRKATETRKQCLIALTNAQNALSELHSDLSFSIAAFTIAKNNHAWKTEVALPADEPPTDLTSLVAWLDQNEAIAQSWANVESSWRGEKKFITTLKGASERYEQNIAKRNTLDALVPRLEEALKICTEQRQAFTSKIIGEIAQEVGNLYEKVHPGEGLDAIALLLDPKKRASIELEAKFSGVDVPPQAYFSQSHLDTLGLCVFLSLAARDQQASDTILILDDVLGSVDEPHVERIVSMIYEVSESFRHTIVTTHYRPWRERFRWGSLKPGQHCQFVELSRWDITDGMKHIGCLPEIDRLKGMLSQTPQDTQAICGKAGVILEYALDFLTLRYECRVPRRNVSAYTIGELLSSIDNKLREALKIEIRDGLTDTAAPPTTTVHLKPILDEITRIAQVRNALGAHFKAISFDLLDQDAIAFANQVVHLVDALSHPDHGWPSNDKSGSYWRNSGDSRRLHPLKKPR